MPIDLISLYENDVEGCINLLCPLSLLERISITTVTEIVVFLSLVSRKKMRRYIFYIFVVRSLT